MTSQTVKTHCIRLVPGQDLKLEILKLCLENRITAAVIVSSVGSLKKLNLRLAYSNKTMLKDDFFEIISLNGTVSFSSVHLHLSVADQNGNCFGGHLLEENLIYTTCELVILEIAEVSFLREKNSETGFKELKISEL